MSSSHARRRVIRALASPSVARAFDRARAACAARTATTRAPIAPCRRGLMSLANSPRRMVPASACARVRGERATRENMAEAVFARSKASASVAPPKPTPNREMRDDFLNASSAAYLEAMEDEYRKDPKSVPESWASLLRQMGT